MPKVSIVMSVYNKALYLNEAVDSVLNQMFSDFEFIIADNCSIDNSVEIIKSYNDPRIRFHQNHRNLGAAVSLNSCLDKATGDYVALACGDDVWEEDFLQTCVPLLERHPEVNIVSCRMDSLDSGGKITRSKQSPEFDAFRIVPVDQVVEILARSSCSILLPAALFRRETFPYYDPRYQCTCDWDISFKLVEQKTDFLFVDRALVRYRFYPENETSVAKRDGTLIFESYLNLHRFFLRQPRYRHLRRKAYSTLAMSTLRQSRDLGQRDMIFLYHRFALMIYPRIFFYPAFHLYWITAFLFGPPGMQTLMKASKKVTSVIKRIQGKKT
jgi:glycosyltransferase involved in cell wall biosynthesis